MPHSTTFCYEFEHHRLDVAQRVLTREGQSIPLTPKATDVLLLLLQNAGQLVEKDQLINQVWPDAFVEEANLTQNIFQLRRALRDDGSGPKYIETVARRGYRFVAPVRRVALEMAQDQETVSTDLRRSALPILAVLPFCNATGNIDLQYLAEGIPESIINSLSSLSQLRVISRSSAFRYKNREVDPQTAGQKLGADVLLIGTISGRESSLAVSVELVGVDNAWQLWGQTFKVDSENIFEVQDQITRQISRVLSLPLSHEDEKRVAKRYTENPLAYQAYLEGRFHWSRYTKSGIEKAIVHFDRAIDLDPNYALAYAGIVDCYLRLATNYLPPEDPSQLPGEVDVDPDASEELHSSRDIDMDVTEQLTQEKVKLRHEWDWKGAERELRRANELRTDYPAAHQWHAALVFSRDLFYRCTDQLERLGGSFAPVNSLPPSRMAQQIASLELTTSERVQVFCAVAREQIDSGNYDGACQVLHQWWSWGKWPSFVGLKPESCADLLFTTGRLAGCVASARQIAQGQKHGEALLNGAIALFESVGAHGRVAEAKIELALCYYRQGLFDLGRSTFVTTLS
ncbi:MAG TPA: winged helix-turn-helix domain-containing protein, partial [Pyrinomonadaceae bacterium]